MDRKLYEKTLTFVMDLYAGRIDRDHKPAALHPIEVSLHPKLDGDWHARVLALVHDVVEDGLASQEAVEAALGLSPSGVIAEGLRVITRNGAETYADYIENVALFTLARKVKLADLETSMRRPGGSPTLLWRYIQAYERLS